MTAFLLDVNALIALMWPAHGSHSAVQRWFARNSRHGWATCPLTQASFVRILSNPAFSRDAVTPQEAISVLRANVSHRHHRFWVDEIGFIEVVEPVRRKIVGHQQVTDAYLLGLAIHKGGRLATMDRGVLALSPEDSPERNRVEVISD
jgi:toxin-antitoxin system PIN domain toxin